jgi:hypothetical protein
VRKTTHLAIDEVEAFSHNNKRNQKVNLMKKHIPSKKSASQAEAELETEHLQLRTLIDNLPLQASSGRTNYGSCVKGLDNTGRKNGSG